MADPYLYDDVPVLRNALSIKDEKTLDLIEAEQSRANMMLLYEHGFHDFTRRACKASTAFCLATFTIGRASFVSSTLRNGNGFLRAAACGTATMKRSVMI